MKFEEQEAFVQRMIEEQKDLQAKLVKLNAFFATPKYSEIDEYQKSLLIRQRDAMVTYFETLTARISLNIKFNK